MIHLPSGPSELPWVGLVELAALYTPWQVVLKREKT